MCDRGLLPVLVRRFASCACSADALLLFLRVRPCVCACEKTGGHGQHRRGDRQPDRDQATAHGDGDGEDGRGHGVVRAVPGVPTHQRLLPRLLLVRPAELTPICYNNVDVSTRAVSKKQASDELSWKVKVMIKNK